MSWRRRQAWAPSASQGNSTNKSPPKNSKVSGGFRPNAGGSTTFDTTGHGAKNRTNSFRQPAPSLFHGSPAAGTSRHVPILINDDDFGDFDEFDDAEDLALANEIVELSQDFPSTQQQQFVHYGTHWGKVVGVRYYNGITTPGEHILLAREPSNVYDSNAIRVLNVQSVQVGHIPRNVAKHLAPFLDRGRIRLEGTVNGFATTYELPIKVEIYGSPLERDSIISSLLSNDFPLKGPDGRIIQIGQAATATQRAREAREEAENYRKRRLEEIERAQVLAAGKRARIEVPHMASDIPQAGYLGYGQSGYMGTGQFPPIIAQAQPQISGLTQAQLPSIVPVLHPPVATLQTLVGEAERLNPREITTAVEKFGLGEEELSKMPMAKQPNRLSTLLLPYQLQGLHWLLEHENPKLPTGLHDVVQLWKRHPTNLNQYQNIATNFTMEKPPNLASGGILADDMGLGKTLQIISLIVTDLENGGRKSTHTGGTLIVSPVSVMSNWSQQIAEHVKEEYKLKVAHYHGSAKSKVENDWGEVDIVITSYGTLASDYHGKRNSPLYSLKWRRVILDEAHQIRNPKARASVAASAVDGGSRWALTGTPIVNSLKDFYSLIRFLKFSEGGGLTIPETFHRAIIKPLNQGLQTNLQAVVAALCLRRKKDMEFVNLKLPELTEYVYKVKLEQWEAEKYNLLEQEAQGLLDRFTSKSKALTISQGSSGDSSSQPQKEGNEYRFLLEILLRMRQLCNSWSLVGQDRLSALEERLNEIASAGLTEEMKEILQKMLQMAIDSQEDCSICLDALHNPRITVCRHIFGLECIEKVIELQHKCPMCRHELPDCSRTTLVEPRPAEVAPVNQLQPKANSAALDSVSPEGTLPASSKIKAILSILQATKENDPSSKTVVFSQWTSFLTLLEPHLTSSGFAFTRIDGTMSTKLRDRALERLNVPNKDGGAEIILASLSVASVGLNLVAANQVLLSDCWWAPAIEDQAIDRVYRLGQTRECRVWRVVVERSIEERVLSIQVEKRKLVSTAFREEGEGTKGKKQRGKKEARGSRLQDLQVLLGRAPAPRQNQGN